MDISAWASCPLYPQEQTFADRAVMSALCQQRTTGPSFWMSVLAAKDIAKPRVRSLWLRRREAGNIAARLASRETSRMLAFPTARMCICERHIGLRAPRSTGCPDRNLYDCFRYLDQAPS